MKARQQGMSVFAGMVLLGIIASAVILGLKLVPAYLQNYTIKESLTSLTNEPLIDQKTPNEIRTLLNRRLDMNYVDTLDRKAIKIERNRDGLTIDITYEVRIDIVANIDALLSFSDQVVIRKP